MSVKIYHGPPGSRKTSSAIRDELVRCAEEGRHVICNIRGLTEERARAVLSKVTLPRVPGPMGWFLRRPLVIKEGFKVTTFDQTKKADQDRLRRFWTWTPPGAYFILDELQKLYPPEASAKKMEAYNDLEREYSDGNFPPEWSAEEEEVFENLPQEFKGWRPESLGDAFDTHRHFNLDFCFTTVTIKKVRSEIRGASEWAYKHKNLAGLGMFGGLYVQSMHSAEDNCNQGDVHAQSFRRLPVWVYTVYDSTSTGVAKETQAGRSIFSDPKIVILACIVGACFYMGIGKHGFHLFPVDSAKPGSVDPRAPVEAGGVLPAAQGMQHDGQRPESISGRWRVVGVYFGGGIGYAYITDWKTDRRIGLEHCKRLRAEGWSCDYQGGTVTQYSGTPPPEPKLEKVAAPGLG